MTARAFAFRHTHRTKHNIQSDHAFAIPIPPGLPPSIVLDKSKNTGIVYHLVATAMIKAKSKSLFGGSGNSFKPPSLVTQIAEVTIEKHELNPSWPIYAWQAENTPLQVRQANLSMHLKRETVIFGGNDPVKLDVEIRSERNAPVKITRIELQLKEIITTREADGVARGGSVDPKKTLQHSYDILSLRSPCHNVLYQNESMSHALSAVFPVHHSHFTVQNAKHLDVKYTMRLRAVVEVPKEAKLKRGEKREKEEPIKEIILDNVAVIISPWSKKQAEWWRAKIGTIPKNLQRPDTSDNTQATSVSNQPQMNGQVSNTNMSPLSSSNPASPPRALSGPMVYGSSPAAAASRAFSQRVQQGNQLHASQHSQSSQPLQPVQPLQSTQPAQPSATLQAEPMNATRSQEEQRALAIQQGKRLSSWPPPERKPPPPPTIAVSEHEPGTSDTALPPSAAESQEVLATAEQHYQPTQGRQTQSDVGHGTMFWQPSREVASLDGHAAQLRHSPPPKPYQMDGAYPVARSKSHSQGINTMGYANPWSPPASVGHRRVFSDGGRSTRQGSQPTPPHIPYYPPDQSRRLSTPALSSSTPTQLNSTPVLSSSIPINIRKDSNGSQTRKRMHVETTHGGFPTRKNTLSTITGSAPSSAQSSPIYETQSVPMPSTEWESAEAEKERLYNEATERARRTQERAGNTIPEAMPVDEQYRSVQDRTPTPLSLMRTVSNPETGDARRNEIQGMYGLGPPSPMHNNRHSVASTQLGYLNSRKSRTVSAESCARLNVDPYYRV